MRRITLSELLDRLRQAAWARAEAFSWVRERLTPDVRDVLVPGANADAVMAGLARCLPTWSSANGDYPGPFPEPRRGGELMRLAANALSGRFDLLGLKEVDFGQPVDWHLEPTQGMRLPLIPWKRLDSLVTDRSGDKKVVWEMNRHQHLVVLARAWCYTHDPRFADAVVEHLASWLRTNPPALGINWVSSLELAFRAINWLWAIALLGSSENRRPLPARELCVSLHQHGVHIERFLSTYSSPNTHLTGEALGLYYLGTCLPELRCAPRWRARGRKILLEQLRRQIHADGVYFEQSTWYHRYTADIYMHFLLLAERVGDPLPTIVRQRLSALLEHLMWMTRPDGSFPLIGDDDGGRLAALEERVAGDWRAVLSSGALVLERGDFKHVAGELAEETRWLLGPWIDSSYSRIAAQTPTGLSRAFPDGGYFVMRSGWYADSHYLLVDCGPHGMMNCGHAHADALAIEVASYGETLLVDPGTFTYSSPLQLRDRFRSSPVHNTVSVDGESSSVPAGPFQWKHVAKSRLHRWHDHLEFTYFEGSHDGYRRLADPVTHVRMLLFPARQYWLMLDRVEAAGKHMCEVLFQAAPGASVSLYPRDGCVEVRRGSAVLEIAYPAQAGDWRREESYVSPCFGVQEVAPRAVFQVKCAGSRGILAVLVPGTTRSPRPSIASLRSAPANSVIVVTHVFRDLALWRVDLAAEAGVVANDFEWLWVRRSVERNSIERGIMLHGAHANLDDLELCTERPVDFVTLSIEVGVLSIDVSPPVVVAVRAPPGTVAIRVNGAADLARVLNPVI